jgi:signal transduction histidine kinase
MQAGQLDYREERFEINTMVQDVVENIQGTTQTHRLLLEEQSQAEVYGDPDRIGQVLVNLLNNAIKYSPQANEPILVWVWVSISPVRLSSDTVESYGWRVRKAKVQRFM